MIFITEADLREQFKNQIFTNFKLPPETKLTPGARQFLLDRGIDLYNEEYQDNQNTRKNLVDREVNLTKPIRQIKLLQAETLLCGAQLIENNIELAQEISKISRQISNIIKYVESGLMVESLECKKCAGMCNDNFSLDIGDCFEINDFHIQVENGKAIINLHRLRLLYRCFCEELGDYEFRTSEAKTQVEKFTQEIINTISKLICAAYGGKQCQRL